jgi:hypothetical protein
MKISSTIINLPVIVIIGLVVVLIYYGEKGLIMV